MVAGHSFMVAGRPPLEDDHSNADVTIALSLAEQSTTTVMMARLSARGYRDVTASALSVIALLNRLGTRRVGLAKRTGLSRPALGRALRTMVEGGYVEQIADPDDGRVPLLRLTNKGVALGDACRAVSV